MKDISYECILGGVFKEITKLGAITNINSRLCPMEVDRSHRAPLATQIFAYLLL